MWYSCRPGRVARIARTCAAAEMRAARRITSISCASLTRRISSRIESTSTALRWRGHAGAGLRSHRGEPTLHARVDARVTQCVEHHGLVGEQLGQLLVERSDRQRPVDGEALGGGRQDPLEAVPDLALGVLVAAKERRLLALRADRQHQRRLGLAKAGQVVEVAVPAGRGKSASHCAGLRARWNDGHTATAARRRSARSVRRSAEACI